MYHDIKNDIKTSIKTPMHLIQGNTTRYTLKFKLWSQPVIKLGGILLKRNN